MAVQNEIELIQKINTIYSTVKRQRYNELYEKFKDQVITPKEYQELLKSSDELEMLNAERLGYIGKLVEMRGQSFEKVVGEFKIRH